MDSYKEDNPEFRKQLLIPLVVLLLCAISLTAVGFAYMHASQLEIEKNGLDSEYYEIDYTDKDGVTFNGKLDAVKLSAYTKIAIDPTANPPGHSTHISTMRISLRSFSLPSVPI